MGHPSSLLVTTVKNEGPNILEWVAHHRLCGFDRIQVFQNDSTDTTVQSLRILDRLGIVEFHQNRHHRGAHQMRAYRRSSRSDTYGQSDWCMVLDGDEFLHVKAGVGTVADLIAACPEGADAILVNWRLFGSNGETELSERLVTERFTRAERAGDIVAGQLSPFKPLFRTAAYERAGIHLPRKPIKEAPLMVNGSGLPEGEFDRQNWRGHDPLGRRFAQVNHYITRDLASFLLKTARGSANAPHRDVGARYWRTYNRNDEEDLGLATRAPAILAEMQRLDDLSGGRLMSLRTRALRQWRINLEAALEEPELLGLRDAILGGAATGEPEAEAEETPPVPEPAFPIFSTSRLAAE